MGVCGPSWITHPLTHFLLFFYLNKWSKKPYTALETRLTTKRSIMDNLPPSPPFFCFCLNKWSKRPCTPLWTRLIMKSSWPLKIKKLAFDDAKK